MGLILGLVLLINVLGFIFCSYQAGIAKDSSNRTDYEHAAFACLFLGFVILSIVAIGVSIAWIHYKIADFARARNKR